MPDDAIIPFQPKSAFQNTPVYKVGDDLVYGLLKPAISFLATDPVQAVTGMTENRLDAISNAAYGTPDYWWVLAEANDIVDVQAGIPAGLSLRVPSAARVAALKII